MTLACSRRGWIEDVGGKRPGNSKSEFQKEVTNFAPENAGEEKKTHKSQMKEVVGT